MNDLNGKNMNCEFTQICIDFHRFITYTNSVTLEDWSGLPKWEMQETQVRSLGWEDPLEEEMATLSSILDWRIPWTEEPSGLQSVRS